MIYFGDVDAVVKLASCGFLSSLPALLGTSPEDCQVRYLGSLRSRLSRPNKKLTNPDHQRDLDAFCSAHAIIEGSASVARQQELLLGGMDAGEALLFAEAEATGGVVVTGDKRALAAYARCSTAAQRAKIKVVCWEQLLLRVYAVHGYERLKQGCCDGIACGCDKLLVLVFSSGLATQEEHALAALESYLTDVRRHSADILLVFTTP